MVLTDGHTKHVAPARGDIGFSDGKSLFEQNNNIAYLSQIKLNNGFIKNPRNIYLRCHVIR